MLLAFSLYGNLPTAFRTQKDQESVTCLNGIQVLTMCWIILAQTLLAMIDAYPFPMSLFDNSYYSMKTFFRTFSMSIVSNSSFAIDTLLVVNGFILSYYLLSSLRMNPKTNSFQFWLAFYTKEYVKIIGPLVFVLLSGVVERSGL